MTNIYDARAARTYAKGEAEKAQAEAEALRAETARKNVEVIAERERRVRRERRATRREWFERRKRHAPETALAALWAAVIVAPLLLAWEAQAAFAAETLQIPVALAWLFPLAIEAGAWVCAFESLHRSKRGAPAGSLPRWMWVLAGIAASINAAHGTADHGIVAGLALGALSMLGVLLHHIRQNLTAAEQQGSHRSRVSQGFLRWVLFPSLTLAALRNAVRANRGVDEAWETAWIDRHGVGPAATKRDRQLARAIIKRQRRKDRKAAKHGRFVILNGVILRAELPALTPPEIEPTGEPYSPTERAKLSATASELLPKVQASIAAGELSERPSAYAINKRFKGGMPAAQEVRDALTDMHPVGAESEVC